MSIVSSVGLGSGIDIQDIVSKLSKAESQPALNAISRQKTIADTRLSGLGTLKSALSDFQAVVAKFKDGSLFKTHKSTSSDETILKVTAGTGSAAGSYAVKVTQLAAAQKSITAAEFTDSAALVGGGTLTIGTGSASFEVTTAGTTTLEGLRDAINGASDNSLVTASIINVDHVTVSALPVQIEDPDRLGEDPPVMIDNPDWGSDDPLHGTTVSRLVLTAKDTGVENKFTVTANEGGFGPGLSRFASDSLQSQVDAADAIIEIDGQTATRSSNSISDVLTGVTLNLQKVSAGTTVNVNVGVDNEAIKTAVNEFVTAYNKLSSTTQSLGKYGGSTDGSGSGNGALIGNSTLRYISSQLRQNATDEVFPATTNKINSLAMIGVTIDKDGVMSLDSTKLDAALAADSQSLSNVFSSSQGVAVRMHNRLSGFLQSGGPLDTQRSSLKKQLSALESRKLDIQERQNNVEAMLLKQFTAMDISVGSFNSTGNFLSNWLKNL